MESLALVVTLMLIYMGVLIFFVIIPYIFYAIGLQRMAKRDNIKNPWLAWIPFGNIYITGELTKHSPKIKSGKRLLLLVVIPSIIYFISLMVGTVLSSVFDSIGVSLIFIIIGLISLMVAVVFNLIATYQLLAKYTQHAILIFVLGLFLTNLISTIAIFVIRNNPILVGGNTEDTEYKTPNEENEDFKQY